MRAEIRGIYSRETPDLNAWKPPVDEFAIHVRLMVGPQGLPGEEAFDVTLCSASFLERRAQKEGVVDARHHLVVDCFNWSVIEAYLKLRVHACQGASWDSVAAQVARFAYWELEDSDDG